MEILCLLLLILLQLLNLQDILSILVVCCENSGAVRCILIDDNYCLGFRINPLMKYPFQVMSTLPSYNGISRAGWLAESFKILGQVIQPSCMEWLGREFSVKNCDKEMVLYPLKKISFSVSTGFLHVIIFRVSSPKRSKSFRTVILF